jgi:hypothetical protein
MTWILFVIFEDGEMNVCARQKMRCIIQIMKNGRCLLAMKALMATTSVPTTIIQPGSTS